MTQTFVNIYDLSRKKVAVLQNAYEITEKQDINDIYELKFSLPETDEKVQHCQPFYFARYGADKQLYRIAKQSGQTSDTGQVTYTCEHAIATLCDTLLFGSYTYGGAGTKTRQVIEWLLSKQPVRNWILDECDFDAGLEYCWEEENILNALYSVPQPFVDPYMWRFDCSVYPWKLSLKRIDVSANPGFYIRAKRNLLGSGVSSDHAEICTRLYPLGYGEGVNQLTIKEVNGGVPYLEAPASVIAQYGIIERVLVDRRFESAESLKAYGQTMLDQLSSPRYERTFDVADLYPMTGAEIDAAEVGKICRLTGDGTTVYITGTERVLDDPGNLRISLSNKSSNVADTIADLADRVRIETVYAQGATQIYQHAKDANATPDKGMVMSLYFPSEMRQINKVLLRLKLNKFRSYSQSTDSKTVTVKTNAQALTGLKTTADGGGTTSSSGGTTVTVGGGAKSGQSTDSKDVSVDVSASGVSFAPQVTTTSAPSTNVSSGAVWSEDGERLTTTTEGTNNGAVEVNLGDKFYGGTYALYSGNDGYHSHDTTYWESGMIDGGYHSHNVSVDVPVKTFKVKNNTSGYGNEEYHAHSIVLNALSHKHNINHYHTVAVTGAGTGGSHSHTFKIPNHSHTLTSHSHNLPDLSHRHEITLEGHKHAIEAGIFESGKPTAFDIYVGNVKKATVNTTSYDGDITAWLLNDKNQVPRNTWINVEIRPNDLAYVVSSVFVQGFVQSRGGGNY